MIVSHLYRFIFIKCKKTAGTSVEIALSSILGDQDVIAPIHPIDEELRNRLEYRGPQNHLDPSDGSLAFYNHMPAKEIKEKMGTEIWDSYYKFCFVRNPWDRLISLYYWHYRDHSTPLPSMTEFLQWLDEGRMKRYDNFLLYTIDGEMAVDRVGRYESLERDLQEVCTKLGLPNLPLLPRAKGQHRLDRRHYREVLSLEESEKIRRLCENEIDLFDYQF